MPVSQNGDSGKRGTVLNKIKDALKELGDWTETSRPLSATNTDLFPRPDTARFARELKIEECARNDGRDNIPPSNSNSLSPTEQNIKAQMREVGATYSAKYQAEASSYSSRYQTIANSWRLEIIEN